jgi:hypothetical protein
VKCPTPWQQLSPTEQWVRDPLSFVLPDSNITAMDNLDEG